MKCLAVLSLGMVLVTAGHANGNEMNFQRDALCERCPAQFTLGPVTTEKALCTTMSPHKIPVGTVRISIDDKEISDSFDFTAYRVNGADVQHLDCEGFRGISGEFKGTLKDHIALVSYRHSWNGSGEPDTARIVVKPTEIEWHSLGMQHGYLGMMPKFMFLPRIPSQP